jgi:hypothetical protein
LYFDSFVTVEHYLVSEEAREFLRSIKGQIAVIAVAGKYRTGKSFLLNRVILNQRDRGFGVGPTINPCTKGLWMWCEPITTTYNGEKLSTLVIDSEGIGAFDEDVNHDTKIFLLALLLCSSFIFNSMNTIDENAINSLSLIINLSKELQIKSELLGEADPEDIQKYFPSFLWVVRDFSLRLTDQQQNAITCKQYLENSLQPQKGHSDAVEEKNRIRRMIKQFFKERDCFTMVRPVENESELQKLQLLPDQAFRPQFQEQVESLRSRIYKKTKPKVLNGKVLNGEMLLELCIAYTDAINTGSVPNIQNAWSYVCQNEHQRLVQSCLREFEDNIKEPLARAKADHNISILKQAFKQIRESCALIFRKEAMLGGEGQSGLDVIQELEIKLRNMISDKFRTIKQEFIRHCQVLAKKYLDQEAQRIRRNIQSAQYESLDQVQDELKLVKANYVAQGKAPVFPGYEILIAETMQEISAKASDYLNISLNQANATDVRRLTERVKELESEIRHTRVEHQGEVINMQVLIAKLEAEKTQLHHNFTLSEDRLKRLAEEKGKQIEQLTLEAKTMKDLNEQELLNVKHKLELNQMEKRYADQSQQKKVTELEKLHALIE